MDKGVTPTHLIPLKKSLLGPFYPHFRPQKRGCFAHFRGFFSGIHISQGALTGVFLAELRGHHTNCEEPY